MQDLSIPPQRPLHVQPCHKLIAAADAWSRHRGEPHKLTMMLHHDYTLGNLSFHLLKGRDEAIVEALQHSGMFELRLALIEKKKIGSADEEYYSRDPYAEPDEYEEEEDEGTSCSATEKADSDAGYHDTSGSHKMIEHISTTFAVSEMINEDDNSVSVGSFSLDVDHHMIDGNDPFDELNEPDDEEFEVTGNEGATVEYSYHRAFLVIWPRLRAPFIDCDTDFATTANRLLAEVSTGNYAAANETLATIVTFGQDNVERVRNKLPELLNAACSLSNIHAVKSLIDLFCKPVSSLSPFSYISDQYRESCDGIIGCCNSEVSNYFMKAIELFGWEEMNTHILEAIRKTHVRKVNHCADLAMSLRTSTLENADRIAFLVAEATTSLFLSQRVSCSSAPAVVNMTFHIPECVESQKRIVAKCSELSCEGLASAIELVDSTWRGEKSSDAFVESFHSLVKSYISNAFLRTEHTLSPMRAEVNHAGPVLSVVLSSELASEGLVDLFVEALLGKGRGEQIRDVLRTRQLSRFANNRHIYRIARARVEQIAYAVPVLSNRQPDADISGHAMVTSFLHGNERSMTYNSFGSIKEARRFVSMHFSEMGGSMLHNRKYSACATAHGRGKDSYVLIEKTDILYKEQVRQYAKDQKELKELQSLINASSQNDGMKRRKLNCGNGVGSIGTVIDLTMD